MSVVKGWCSGGVGNRKSWTPSIRNRCAMSILNLSPCVVSRGRCWKPRPRHQVRLASSDSAASVDLPPQRQSAPAGALVQLWYHIRALAFVMTAFSISTFLFTLMLVATPFVFLFDRNRSFLAFPRSLFAGQGGLLLGGVSMLSSTPSGREFQLFSFVEGKENLPPSTEAAVYVANHQSFMDIFALFFLDRPIKFISKTSIFLFPLIGWSMFLTGHIPLDRLDRRSQLKCLKECQDRLEKNVPIVFFPEGTRSSDKKLKPFKKGAFSIAVKTGAPVVPITLIGTGRPTHSTGEGGRGFLGDLMPKGKELELRQGSIRVVVHPRLESKGRDATELCQEAQDVIAASLPI